MDIFDWIAANPLKTCIALIVIIAMTTYVYVNKREILFQAALHAVAVAEDQWGSDTGKIKFAEVYTYLKKQYPVLTLFFTEEKLTQIIEDALVRLKTILATKAKKEREKLEAEAAQQTQVVE